MKRHVQFILLGIFILLVGCTPKQVKETKFNEHAILNDYKIKLPDYVNKIRDNFWQSPRNNKNVKNIEITVKRNNNTNLETAVNKLSNKNNSELYKNKTFVKNEPFTINGMKGLISYYKKDNNKGIIPVMTYFVFAVIRDNGNLIEFSSVSLNDDVNNDMKSSIYSIARN